MCAIDRLTSSIQAHLRVTAQNPTSALSKAGVPGCAGLFLEPPQDRAFLLADSVRFSIDGTARGRSDGDPAFPPLLIICGITTNCRLQSGACISTVYPFYTHITAHACTYMFKLEFQLVIPYHNRHTHCPRLSPPVMSHLEMVYIQRGTIRYSHI